MNKQSSGAEFHKQAAKKQVEVEEENLFKKLPKIRDYFNVVCESFRSKPDSDSNVSNLFCDNTIPCPSSTDEKLDIASLLNTHMSSESLISNKD